MSSGTVFKNYESYYGSVFKLLERLLKILAYLLFIKQGDMLFFVALFESYVPRVLLWCWFQTVGKIAQNLSIFTLH